MGIRSQSANGQVSILVADDDSLVRSALRTLISERPDWKIVGFAKTAKEAVEKSKVLSPDLIIIDTELSNLDPLNPSTQILQFAPSTCILMLSRRASRELLAQALSLGIDGYVLRSDPESYVVDAIDAIQRGNSFLTPSITTMLREGLLPQAESTNGSRDHRLTLREREVVRLVAEGKSNKEVATSLGISLKTAENHRARAMRRLKLHSFSELVRYAVRAGFVEP